MTTNASPIAGDYSEGFFNINANKRMAPAQKKSCSSTTKGTCPCPLLSSRKDTRSLSASRLKRHGVWSGHYGPTSSLSISPTQVERIFLHCRNAVSWPAASLLLLQHPSLAAEPLAKLSKKSPPSFSLFHWDQMALGKYCMIWTCQMAGLIRAYITVRKRSLGKRSFSMRPATDSVGEGIREES
jgi:hypothetical protein